MGFSINGDNYCSAYSHHAVILIRDLLQIRLYRAITVLCNIAPQRTFSDVLSLFSVFATNCRSVERR